MKIIQASCMAALTLCLAGVSRAYDLQTVGDPDITGFSARRLGQLRRRRRWDRVDQRLVFVGLLGLVTSFALKLASLAL